MHSHCDMHRDSQGAPRASPAALKLDLAYSTRTIACPRTDSDICLRSAMFIVTCGSAMFIVTCGSAMFKAGRSYLFYRVLASDRKPHYLASAV